MNFNINESELERSDKITFRFSIDLADFGNISAVLAYMKDSLSGFFKKNPGKNYIFYSMVFDISDELEVNERIFWSLIAEKSGDYGLVVNFVRELTPLVTDEDGTLIYSDEQHFFFSHLIIEHLDHIFLLGQRDYNQGKSIIELFYFYLEHCDLDFETFQDEYILKSLDYCKMLEPVWLTKFLAFRLSEGQLSEKPFEFFQNYLDEKEALKMLIDRLASSKDDYIQLCTLTYLQPCVSIYGSATDKIDEILIYVENKIKDKLQPLSKHDKIRISRNRGMCDSYREHTTRKNGILDTGFHRYDYAEKKWGKRTYMTD